MVPFAADPTRVNVANIVESRRRQLNVKGGNVDLLMLLSLVFFFLILLVERMHRKARSSGHGKETDRRRSRHRLYLT